MSAEEIGSRCSCHAMVPLLAVFVRRYLFYLEELASLSDRTEIGNWMWYAFLLGEVVCLTLHSITAVSMRAKTLNRQLLESDIPIVGFALSSDWAVIGKSHPWLQPAVNARRNVVDLLQYDTLSWLGRAGNQK